MRSGELCSLKWPDMNFDTNEVRIIKTIYSKGRMGTYELTPPKTTGSIRTIDIDSSVMELFVKYKSKQEKLLVAAKKAGIEVNDKGFVFCRSNGYPYYQASVIRRMRILMKKTEIKKHATPHIFRHTHISMLAEAGVDITTIMKPVGHDEMKTTMKIYTHVTDNMKKNASDKIKNMFGDILEF
ncbi:tyrosine-type recombinase/integrase [Paenibacillus agricola]|uniref:Site-specific integrase n=1 Tax=Paenibacillus agricola TaxID=2716264 RepID=A0ABX0J602_9BACL|nr:site-specific integrase [Paenibacillus agricola]